VDLAGRATARLWRAMLSVDVVPYLLRHGIPIRYSYVQRDWALPFYQTVFAREPGSAEMPSASRPFTPPVVSALAARGVLIAPLTLHAGVSSLEADEDPYPEPYDVPPATARLVNHVRSAGGRVIAAGTTVVRALETAVDGGSGLVVPSAGRTSHVVTPETGVRAVDGLLTGLHEPRYSPLRMLATFAAAAGRADAVDERLPGGRDRDIAALQRRAVCLLLGPEHAGRQCRLCPPLLCRDNQFRLHRRRGPRSSCRLAARCRLVRFRPPARRRTRGLHEVAGRPPPRSTPETRLASAVGGCKAVFDKNPAGFLTSEETKPPGRRWPLRKQG